MINRLQEFSPAILLIVLTIAVSSYWLSHQPRAERTPPKKLAPLVDIVKPVVSNHSTTISVMGNVIAAQSVNLTPRISGMVKWISPNFIEGGLLKKGEVLVELDPTDYKLAIVQSRNDLEKARYNLKLEQGQQVIVRREYQLLGAELNGQEQELVLRKPHLNAAQAALAAAEANLKLAQLNLERTKPVAPFNAIITTRNANIGAWMSAFSTGTPLAKLVGTDSFWINVSIPVDKLNWVKIPGINGQSGSIAKISYETAWGKDVYRIGKVKSLQAELEPEGRMAKLIIEVDDPLCQKLENKQLPPLMLGTYVRVAIAGVTLEDVIKLPETTLHDDQQLWLFTEKQTLDIRHVSILWTEQNFVFLAKNQLPENSQIISSDIANPVQNMEVRPVKPLSTERK